jgi:hypothetical protein
VGVLCVGAGATSTALATDGAPGEIASRDVSVQDGRVNQSGTYLLSQPLLKCLLSLVAGERPRVGMGVPHMGCLPVVALDLSIDVVLIRVMHVVDVGGGWTPGLGWWSVLCDAPVDLS